MTRPTQDPFAIMPWELAADTRLNSRDYRVLIALLSFRSRSTGLFFATREQIAERCGITPPNISTTTKRLVEFGYLVKHGGGGRGKAVRYEFHVPEMVSTGDTVSDGEKGFKCETVSHGETVSKPAKKGFRRGIHAETLPETHGVYSAREPRPEVIVCQALRPRGQPITPSNPELLAAIRDGITAETIIEAAKAYPDKPASYAIAVCRREHATPAATIQPGDSHANRNRGRKVSTVEQTESGLREFLAEHGA